VLWWLGKRVGEVNFTGAGSSPVLSRREKREVVARCGHGEEWMSTLGARPLHGDIEQPSSCVAGRVAACEMAAPAAAEVQSPYPPALWTCLSPPFLFFLNYSKILNKSQILDKIKVL